MFAPKSYLLLEWANIEQVLRETLRHRYTATAAFYEECKARLELFRRAIKRTPETDEAALYSLMIELHNLSELITSIERSHLEEFSWPFAWALERISEDACGALFFFKAEGGICTYRVRREKERLGIIKRRINSVVFPRALKNCVLLHTILGHEIGHAVVVAHPKECLEIIDTLVSGSVVADPQSLYEWCTANIGVTHEVSKGYLIRQAYSWAEEFFCDLLGVVIMGPSFLPAFQSLLEIQSFAAPDIYVSSHPPFASRSAALLDGARALNLLYSEQSPPSDLGKLTASLDGAFVATASKWASSKFSILVSQQVAAAATQLAQFAQAYKLLAFPPPDAKPISQLLQSLRDEVPPVGPHPAAIEAGSDGKPTPLECETVDFRHVLLAGWVRWSEVIDKDEERFRLLNDFCSHAILQQEGIVYWAGARS